MAWFADASVATHEAAHSVVAVLLGFPLVRLTAEAGEGYAGLCEHRSRHKAALSAQHPARAKEARDVMTVALAGRAALARQSADLARFGGDLDNAWSLARQQTGDDPARAHEAAALVRDATERAEGLVEGFAFAIGTVARQLAFHGTLEGQQAEAIVKAAIEDQLNSTWEAAREPARRALATFGKKSRRRQP